MKQSKLMSFVESAVNILVGFGISFVAQLVFLPMLGVTIALSQNFTFALIMTVISLARSWLLRRLFEALHIRVPLSRAALSILAERRRQIDVEGWTIEHDDSHEAGDLAKASACYALSAAMPLIRAINPDGSLMLGNKPMAWNGRIEAGAVARVKSEPPPYWPWDMEWWKPVGTKRDLERAGALILAELEKFDRRRKRGMTVTDDSRKMRSSHVNQNAP